MQYMYIVVVWLILRDPSYYLRMNRTFYMYEFIS